MAEEIETYTPTPEEQARRRKRSMAIAWTLVALVVVFFVTTIVRLGSNIAMQAGG
jgi:hypothetical protein